MFFIHRKESYVSPTIQPREFVDEFQGYYESEIVAVKLDNIIRDLQTQVGTSRNMEFIELNTEEGWRVYRRSVEFVLIVAVYELYPNSEVVAKFRSSGGLYCEINVPDMPLDDEMVKEIELYMRKIVQENRPIVKEVRKKKDVVKMFEGFNLAEKASLIDTLDKEYVSIYRCGEFYDYFYGPMMGSTGHLGNFAIESFNSGILLFTPDMRSGGKIPRLVKQPKLSRMLAEAKSWGDILHCNYITDLNRFIKNGTIGEVIRISEALQEKCIAEIADHIAMDSDKLRLILIAGPSSSGKTSFAQRLRIQLRVVGLEPISISLDDYFCNREDTPKLPNGTYDYECLEALDVKLFNENILSLMQGEKVMLPRYNFITGKREWDKCNTISLPSGQPIIVEGIHGLNEKLTAAVPRDMKYKIYISPLSQLNIDAHNRIPSTDARMLRRLVRDYKTRGADALKTLNKWPDVRAGEEKYIFPYQEEADVMFNSALIYEIAALQKYAVPLLKTVTPEFPEYTKARRILDFCEYFYDLPNEDMIPNNSILREFIGNSVFF